MAQAKLIQLLVVSDTFQAEKGQNERCHHKSSINNGDSSGMSVEEQPLLQQALGQDGGFTGCLKVNGSIFKQKRGIF